MAVLAPVNLHTPVNLKVSWTDRARRMASSTVFPRSSGAETAAGSNVELVTMTGGREPGYTPFANAPPFEDEEAPLPVSIPANERSHLTADEDTDTGQHADSDPTILTAMVNFIWQGGSSGDAWLHMTAAQVLQPICQLSLACVAGLSDLSAYAWSPA